MNYWLMKSEPDVFGIDHLMKMPKKTEHWNGVRNYQARNMMRDEMKKGDLVFFYHSNCKEPEELPEKTLLQEGFSQQDIRDGITTYQAVGCSKCTGGYRGRTGIYQIMPVSDAMETLILEGGNTQDLEKQAQAENIDYEVTRYGIDDLDRAIADESAHGVVKVLTEPGKDRILGVTIVGEHAGELIAEYITAMRHNLGMNKILGTIHIYPTLAEANKYAAGNWKRAHAPETLLRWIARYHRWSRGV